MPLYNGDKLIHELYNGNTYINELYNGDTKIFDAGWETEISSPNPVSIPDARAKKIDYSILGNVKVSELPDDYIELDYIESDGNLYLITDVYTDDNLTHFWAEVKFTRSNTSNNNAKLLGAWGTNSGEIGTSRGLSTYYFSDYDIIVPHIQYYNAGNLGYTYGWTSNIIELNKCYTFRSELTITKLDTTNNYSIYFKQLDENGTVLFERSDTEELANTNIGSLPLSIFNSKSVDISKSYTLPHPGKIYYAKFGLVDGTPILDAIPCKRKLDGVLGMYNLVNGSFYTNQGTGTFTAGPELPIPSHPITPKFVGEYGGKKNLLVNKSWFEASKTENGLTFINNNNGTVLVNGTATAATNYIFNTRWTDVHGYPTHKYYLTGCAAGGSRDTYYIYDGWDENKIDAGHGIVYDPYYDTEVNLLMHLHINAGVTINNQVFTINFFDLTEMFGSGNEPTSVLEAQLKVAEVFGYEASYYEHDSGTDYYKCPINITGNLINEQEVFTLMGFTWGPGRLIGLKNQLVLNGNFVNVSAWGCNGGISYTVSNNTALVKDVHTSRMLAIYQNITTTAGRKYFFTATIFTSAKTYIYLDNTLVPTFEDDNTWHTAEYVFEASLAAGNFEIGFREAGPKEIKVKNVMRIDLTQMFGVGNEPTTVEEAKAQIAKVFGYDSSYYEYDSGTDYYDGPSWSRVSWPAGHWFDNTEGRKGPMTLTTEGYTIGGDGGSFRVYYTNGDSLYLNMPRTNLVVSIYTDLFKTVSYIDYDTSGAPTSYIKSITLLWGNDYLPQHTKYIMINKDIYLDNKLKGIVCARKNQLVYDGNFEINSPYWNATNANKQIINNTAYLTPTSTSVSVVRFNTEGYYKTFMKYNTTHKYLCMFNIKLTEFDSGGGVAIYIYDDQHDLASRYPSYDENGDVYTFFEVSENSSDGKLQIALWPRSIGENAIIEFRNIQMFDLTDLFGSGNEPSNITIAKLMIVNLLGYLTYYEYDPGSNICISDEINSNNEYIKRVQEVDLGTLNWNNDTTLREGQTYHAKYAYLPLARVTANYEMPYMLCEYYKPDAWSNIDYGVRDKTIGGVDDNHNLWVYDADYNDSTAEEFKTAMNGVKLWYELATPIITLRLASEILLDKGLNVLNCKTEVSPNLKIKYKARKKPYGWTKPVLAASDNNILLDSNNDYLEVL